MSEMPDGNTAALRQHEASEDRAQARFDAYGERAIQSVVDDLFDGKKIAGFALRDFCEDEASAEIETLLLARSRSQDEATTRLDALTDEIEERIREWCGEDLTGEVDERVRMLDDDARDEAQPSRDDV